MDFYAVLERPGNRVSRRRHASSRMGNNQKVSKDEAIEWFKQKFEGNVY